MEDMQSTLVKTDQDKSKEVSDLNKKIMVDQTVMNSADAARDVEKKKYKELLEKFKLKNVTIEKLKKEIQTHEAKTSGQSESFQKQEKTMQKYRVESETQRKEIRKLKEMVAEKKDPKRETPKTGANAGKSSIHASGGRDMDYIYMAGRFGRRENVKESVANERYQV